MDDSETDNNDCYQAFCQTCMEGMGCCGPHRGSHAEAEADMAKHRGTHPDHTVSVDICGTGNITNLCSDFQ